MEATSSSTGGSTRPPHLALEGVLELTPDGVIKHRQTLTSTAPAGTAADYEVEDLITLLPVPRTPSRCSIMPGGGPTRPSRSATAHPGHLATRAAAGPDRA